MDDGLLIEQVEKFKHLYDKKSSLFKDKSARENAWKTIGHILETEAEQCEQRWNVLRNKYAALKRQKRPSGSQAYTISWPYFDAMKFLDAFVLTRVRRISSLKQTDHAHCSTQSDIWPGMYDILNQENVQEELETSHNSDTFEEEPFLTNPASPSSYTQSKLIQNIRKNTEERASSRKKHPDAVAETMSAAFSSISGTLTSYVATKKKQTE